MDRTKKKTIIQSHQKHNKDTGSPQVQIMILTERILEVTAHLEVHKKDNHSRRGLLKMVETRKKLLNYLKDTKPAEYEKVVKEMEEIKAAQSKKAAKKAPAKKVTAKKEEKKATPKKTTKKVEKKTE